jgi:hypothetical protein
VGVMYNEETYDNVSDFDGELEKVAKRVSPVPGGGAAYWWSFDW